ncbi:hypothetical protein CRM71_08830 [Prevotella jejuni]|uniref:Uncharacterized protein n=1 Tax=Prevotella jejuni TaxID=1177574 RepID=A0A2K9HKX4_9BACT|nr:hypothetical protein [Prevotella jejuni]AUI55372.1 hypothetical protein CRM71_08830 [Prevotella jejuni]SNS10206.1 hypothetical protein SAMN06265364_14126 [Prevotella jejuni]
MKKKKLLAVLSLLIIAGLFAYFAYVGGAFLRLTPVTGKQFEQTALTLGFTKAAVDKSAISDKTGIANITVMMKSVKDDLHNVMIDIPLEFYEFKDETDAINYYDRVSATLQMNIKEGIAVVKVNKVLGNADVYKNYNYDNPSFVIVRAGSTILITKFYCNIDSEKEVEQLLNKIKYNFNYSK